MEHVTIVLMCHPALDAGSKKNKVSARVYFVSLKRYWTGMTNE